ncbi:hypothetical protein SAMN05661091_5854 [Paenibacillus uliginis N3/975]|uniref:Uncharacterized protein n=1 Tax=Paenibacillus uliginis N3/975 TaxID=1313296 RepID=A0A1X7HT50_9BACL|nr:hypothetical protein [Paenibacillus uliginis]SMF92496.1 hypothetical protein SAMN05661091_5854 [Paenibacillus uliginis N3/975]
MEKAIRFRAAITALFGLIGLGLAIVTVYVFRLDKNHGSVNVLMLLTLLSVFFMVGHMIALTMLIKKKRRENL